MTAKKETRVEIAARLGITRQALHYRRKKWGEKRAVSTPRMAENPRYKGVDTITSRCARAGIPLNTYYSRIARGLTPEQALGVEFEPEGVMDPMLSSITGDPSLTPRIHAAIDATKAFSESYWTETCNQRDLRTAKARGEDRTAGSIVIIHPQFPGTLEDALRQAEWSSYDHPKIMAPAVGFRTFDVHGMVGVIDLKSIPKDTAEKEKVLLTDPKGTGFAEAQIARLRGQPVPFTTMLLGPNPNDPSIEIVYTFHPGPPIPPSQLASPGFTSREVTVAEAIRLGLQWAKCVAPW